MAPSPPSGPLTRARAKALQDKVTSLLSTLNLDTSLDGVLLTADTWCVIRCEGLEDHPRSYRQHNKEEGGEEKKKQAETSPTGSRPELPPLPGLVPEG